MINKKISGIITPFYEKGTKWQELANLISRKNRDITIVKDLKKDPQLKKIHTQRNKIFSQSFYK